MSGISTGTGLISGIDTASLIEQLLAIEARPKQLAQQRLVNLKAQQTGLLDISSRLAALKSAATAFRLDSLFGASLAASSNSDVITATAAPNAAVGTYSFIVNRLVSTQQILSRGFADQDSTSIGEGSLTLESHLARLSRDTDLSELKGGQGIDRGKIVITSQNNGSVTVDLSTVGTVQELLTQINSQASSLGVSARIKDDALYIEADGSAGDIKIANATGYSTATSLGIVQSSFASSVSGDTLWSLSLDTSLQSLRDGLGVRITNTAGTGARDFTITTRSGATHDILLGDIYATGQSDPVETRVGTIRALADRIESETDGDVTLEISSDGKSLTLVDHTGGGGDLIVTDTSGAASNLGLVTTGVASDTYQGSAVLASLDSVLISSLNGGSGLSGASSVAFSTRDGSAFSVDVSSAASLSDALALINDDPANSGLIRASLNSNGTGLLIEDLTSGSNNLIISGDAADALHIATDPAGTSDSSVTGANLQLKYFGLSTALSTLRRGQGIGAGTFRITDSTGAEAEVIIDNDARTVEDVVDEINSRGLNVTARINDSGDGLIIEEKPGTDGSFAIQIEDLTGNVARNLGINKTAAGVDEDNFIDGSQEKTITFGAADTLQDIVQKINDSNAGVTASIINSGAGAAPYRLTLTAKNTGSEGEFLYSTSGVDLGFTVMSNAQDARLFFGSADPAAAVLLSSSSNSFTGVVNGLTVNAQTVSDTPATITVSRDSDAVVSATKTFIDVFNTAIGRIDALSGYNQEADTKGVLLGDSTVRTLRASLFAEIQRAPTGVDTPYTRLSSVGITIGSGGKLQLDEDKLRQALQDDPQGVADLFAARVQDDIVTSEEVSPGITVAVTNDATFSSLGVFEQIAVFADRYINSTTGILTRRGDTFDDQIEAQNKRISSLDAQLENKRTVLQAQFLAMEKALAQLQSQQSAITSLSRLAG